MQNNNISPQDEDQMIQVAYQNLLNGYLASNHRKKVEVIDKAFKFARDAHKGIRRRSGEPYIMHPLAVATIVSQEIGLGSTSISAALLHDVVEDTDYTVEDIEAQFGEKIARIVSGLTNVGTRPTVGGSTRTVETTLLDFHEDLYEKYIRVDFERFLRGEIRFPSLDALKAQVDKDMEAAGFRS